MRAGIVETIFAMKTLEKHAPTANLIAGYAKEVAVSCTWAKAAIIHLFNLAYAPSIHFAAIPSGMPVVHPWRRKNAD